MQVAHTPPPELNVSHVLLVGNNSKPLGNYSGGAHFLQAKGKSKGLGANPFSLSSFAPTVEHGKFVRRPHMFSTRTESRYTERCV